MLNYALRVNLTIAIVEMVVPAAKVANESLVNGNASVLQNVTLDLMDNITTTVTPLNLTVN